ncbi:bacillithiol peroxidase [Alkalihalophilus pseudofirmus OF4]|uniref:Glutathione peroxidase n=1 Tax=Alkalihalophilus pseudofirmus (strain ATCC BAA-2126 / JCM 17055 / OF4) TaxID=398511 RepID=D3FUF5_ALKPO|nr:MULTISPECIES: glutathione peroxidase [Alkalihalophilus]ADC50125.1 bacillithiol peroxidase [Alkalihalophilus pseudofirmus OF4]MED1599874.1 glutathione peroxidase [Alkalihalophilus marmarensis]WEG17431.1 glutathione peroxidase [Alkalihalophilus pseudofirmus]
MSTVHDFTVQSTKGEEVSLSTYKGQIMLIVNTATKCGLAPQFKGLEKLHQQYKDKGLAVLGFPCNQFMNQEPVSDEQMTEACEINFGVTFPLFAKINVNGSDAHPLYKHLKKEQKGLLSSEIKWNFTKFLVDKNGEVVKRFGPNTSPEKMEDEIKELLGQ